MTTIHDMKRALLRTWTVLLIPSTAALSVSELLRASGRFDGWRLAGHETLQVVVFVLAACTALALPILYRAAFASSQKGRSAVPAGMYFRYTNNCIVLALLTPYFSLLSSLLGFAPFYLVGIFLMSLYAVYTQYPSVRRLEADVRIFRVTL